MLLSRQRLSSLRKLLMNSIRKSLSLTILSPPLKSVSKYLRKKMHVSVLSSRNSSLLSSSRLKKLKLLKSRLQNSLLRLLLLQKKFSDREQKSQRKTIRLQTSQIKTRFLPLHLITSALSTKLLLNV